MFNVKGDPFDTFTDEVLWKIFEDATDPNDLNNYSQTCTRWEEWIRKEKPKLVLFSGVIRHLQLSKNDLLNCRQVCTSWKKGVDEAYENYPLHLSYEYMRLSKGKNWRHDGIRFSESQQIVKFLADMNSYPGNPFPGRCIEIYYGVNIGEANPPRSDEQFWSRMEELLQSFGDQIWYAYITYDCARNEDPFATYVEVNLRNCLMLLPNLKKLYLDSEMFASVPYLNIDGTRRELGQVHMFWVRQRVMNHFRMNPLTPMKNLETLSLGYSSANYIHYELFRCNSNTLKRVDFGKGVYDHDFQLPNLEEAYVRAETVNDLAQLDRFPPTMRKISVERAYRSHSRQDNPRHSPLFQYPFEQVFRKLERFGANLTVLEVDINLSPCMNYQPQLPALERLTISVSGQLDFLLGFPRLKYLALVNTGSDQLEGPRIQLNGFENKMDESNIWELMPALQTLVIDECSRFSGSGCKFQRKHLRKSKTQCVIM